MPKFNLLSVTGDQETVDNLLLSVKKRLYDKGTPLKNCYFNLQGQLLAEGWVYDSKTLIEVDLGGELKPEWYNEALSTAIEKIKKTEVSDKNYPAVNAHMLPFLKAYFFSYIEKALAKIDEEEGSLVQKLNAKLSFLSTLKSSFRAKFSGEWAHQFYFDHSSALNEVAGFDSEGECPQSYFALFNAFEAVGNKDRKAVTLALTLDKFSSTQVVCDNREIFSTEQVDGLNYRINLGQQNLFYDQLKAELHLPEKYLGAHVKALMESEERFNLKPIHREMYLYANYAASHGVLSTG